MPGIAAVFLAFVVLAILLRAAAGSADRGRIERYVSERGGRIVSISWAPFGRGWFGEQNDRIYEVVYYDDQGRQHLATCKTSLAGGVYWTEDRVAHQKPRWFEKLPARNEPGHPPIAAIDEEAVDVGAEITGELKRLRDENERLRGLLGRDPAEGAGDRA